MKSTVLLVVASIHLGGSYYNQTSLSSVLSTFEAQLTVPRRKEAEQTAPVATTAPAATPLLRADDTSKDMPADATLTPADATPTPATVASVDTSSTTIQVLADNSSVDEPADPTLLPANVTSVDKSLAATQVFADNSTVDEPADSTLLPANVTSVDESSTEIQVIADNSTVDEPADSPLLPANVASVDTSSAVIQVDKESSAKSTSTAVTKLLAETSTMSTEPAVTRSTTKVSTSSARVPQERAGLPQQREVGQDENTAPRAVHVVANSGSSHVWTFKEVSLVAHLSQVLWLCALTGISTYFIGAQALLWRAVENLRRARAQAVHV